MNEQFPSAPIAREDVISTYRSFVEMGIDNPFDIPGDEVSELDIAYHSQQEKIKPSLSFEDRIRADIADSTIFYDAGFTDPLLLGEITEWLTDTLTEVDNRQDEVLADELKSKINDIETKIKESDPSYVLTNWDELG